MPSRRKTAKSKVSKSKAILQGDGDASVERLLTQQDIVMHGNKDDSFSAV